MSGSEPAHIGGLIKDISITERGWMAVVEQRDRKWTMDSHQAGFRFEPDETLAGLLDDDEQAATETDAIIAGMSRAAAGGPGYWACGFIVTRGH